MANELQKLTLEYEDRIVVFEGKNALKWQSHVRKIHNYAIERGVNPFLQDPVTPTVVSKYTDQTNEEVTATPSKDQLFSEESSKEIQDKVEIAENKKKKNNKNEFFKR